MTLELLLIVQASRLTTGIIQFLIDLLASVGIMKASSLRYLELLSGHLIDVLCGALQWSNVFYLFYQRRACLVSRRRDPSMYRGPIHCDFTSLGIFGVSIASMAPLK